MTSVLGGIQNTVIQLWRYNWANCNGVIIGATGSYMIALVISGISCFVTALIYIFMLKDIKPIEVKI